VPGVLSIVMPFSGKRELDLALAAVTVIDIWQIRWHRLPELYASGVRYVGETCRAPNVPGACERFLTALQCIAERGGDCDDLAPWRAAELILAGDLRARAIAHKSNAGWHCVVRRGDGTIEDPSKLLGMVG
jgi:hypothetical protein